MAVCALLSVGHRPSGVLGAAAREAPGWGTLGGSARAIAEKFDAGTAEAGGPKYRKNFCFDSGADIDTCTAPGDGAMGSGINTVQFDKIGANRASKNAHFKHFFPLGGLRWNTEKYFKFTKLAHTPRDITKKRWDNGATIGNTPRCSLMHELNIGAAFLAPVCAAEQDLYSLQTSGHSIFSDTQAGGPAASMPHIDMDKQSSTLAPSLALHAKFGSKRHLVAPLRTSALHSLTHPISGWGPQLLFCYLGRTPTMPAPPLCTPGHLRELIMF